MLVGQHPFRGASVFPARHPDQPTDLRTVNERVSPLARIVMRLLQKAPDARFSRRDLAGVSRRQLMPAPPASRQPPQQRGKLGKSVGCARVPIDRGGRGTGLVAGCPYPKALPVH
jgi:hypothetical protein